MPNNLLNLVVNRLKGFNDVQAELSSGDVYFYKIYNVLQFPTFKVASGIMVGV